MANRLNIVLSLILLGLVVNFLHPFFSTPQAHADEPFQVATLLKSRFRKAVGDVEDKLEKVEGKIKKHTHELKVCSCEEDVPRIKVDSSKP